MWLSSAQGCPGQCASPRVAMVLLTCPLTSPHTRSMALVLLGLSVFTYKACIMMSSTSQQCWEDPLRPEAERSFVREKSGSLKGHVQEETTISRAGRVLRGDTAEVSAQALDLVGPGFWSSRCLSVGWGKYHLAEPVSSCVNGGSLRSEPQDGAWHTGGPYQGSDLRHRCHPGPESRFPRELV